MSATSPKDTLAYHLSRAMLHVRSIETVPCANFATALTAFKKAYPKDVRPETDALSFYQLTHALALIQQRRHKDEPLPADELALVKEYFEEGSVLAQRALYYLIIICQRETRHLHDKSGWGPKIVPSFGQAVYDYIASLPDDPGSAMSKFRSQPPQANIGPYLRAISTVFHKGKWGGGFGGHKWGNIADCALAMVKGDYSPAMMLDTVWTLCHNNGPIFNKGDLYTMYSGNCLIQLLDVQRAGMIPTLIQSPVTPMANMAPFITAAMKERNERIFKLFPDLPTSIDWQKVQELGAVLNWVGSNKGSHAKKAIKISPKIKVGSDQLLIYPGFALTKIKMKRSA
jgi:hypothetical protein